MVFRTTLATFPNFLAYFVTAGVLTALFMAVYGQLTPHREITLIRAGNNAAALAASGSMIGFVVPLASVIAHSAGLIDLVIWGIVALVVQIGGFLVMRVVLPGLPRAIEEDRVAVAIFLAGASISLGILNAACMSG